MECSEAWWLRAWARSTLPRLELVRVVGEGRNHWACIYDRDLADLYLRVATTADASGIFHANDEADESDK